MQSNKKQILTHFMNITFHNHSPLQQATPPRDCIPLKRKPILADFRGLTLRQYLLRTDKTNHTNCQDNIQHTFHQTDPIEPRYQANNLNKRGCAINLSKRVTKNKTEMVSNYRNKNQKRYNGQIICNHSISFQHQINRQLPLTKHILSNDEPSQFCTKNSIDLVSKYSKFHRHSINHQLEKGLPKKSTSLVIPTQPSNTSKLYQFPNKTRKIAHSFIPHNQKANKVSTYEFPIQSGSKRSHLRLKQILMRMGYKANMNKTLIDCLRVTIHK